MRKLFILLLVASTAFALKTNAQAKNGKISGIVVDGSSKIIESATITLKNAKDSSIAKISVADKTGNILEQRYGTNKAGCCLFAQQNWLTKTNWY